MGNSGKIDSANFIRCLSKANMKAGENEIKVLVADLNQDKDGTIDYDDFLRSCYLSYIYLQEHLLKSKLIGADTT
jgi:Ca2+-binding EF-hand superfamily protein